MLFVLNEFLPNKYCLQMLIISGKFHFWLEICNSAVYSLLLLGRGRGAHRLHPTGEVSANDDQNINGKKVRI